MSANRFAADRGEAVLEVDRLDVRFGKRHVLRHLELEIGRSEVFGLLGPNGAGKTTLIRAICGRVRPASGDIRIVGQSNRDRHTLHHIGLVPQEIALYMHLTARENLDVFGALSGLSRSERRQAIAWAAHATRLDERLEERVDIFSGGWKRRVNIAAAILHQPDLLILDEPTVGVDVDARNELHEVIRDLSAGGMAVLLATHDLDQAEALCSRVGFLRGGVIGPQGAPRHLIDLAFQGGKEVMLELRRPPEAEGRAALAEAGFMPSHNTTIWTTLGMVIDETLTGLSARLESLGSPVREIRVREPGLDSLFLHLARNEAGPDR
ncbi:ABC transporter ATP-binding protein [Arsenicitalea aurantiaca]|uniref:ABC transporter ATP-binding protein n=1 Tax=Arsenicitalea aurantiaca TaxID=1783274 RepID=A0A433XF71_9HYPH|nr:ABC transporter ATP-binding protein [Arsenicitalea aurantiaca]RUT32767.1 ABC transporter ATP-binding protein [Arsenicitalea aurantiaca]